MSPGIPCPQGPVLVSCGCHRLGGAGPFIHSQFWRPEVQGQSVHSAVLPPEAPFLPLLASGGSQQCWASLGLWLHHSHLCLCCHMAFVPVCLLDGHEFWEEPHCQCAHPQGSGQLLAQGAHTAWMRRLDVFASLLSCYGLRQKDVQKWRSRKKVGK